MWSKQAADTRDKNMTSFKNKITNRKRKSANPTPTAAVVTIESSDTNTSANVKDGKVEAKKKHQRSGKNKANRNRNKNPVGADVKKTEEPSDDITRLIINKDLETADVVLRNDPKRNPVDPAKRHSDSYVIENVKVEKPEQLHTLTRAVSGFFVIDHTKKNSRRLSDIFRHGTMKLSNSNSTENLKNALKTEGKKPTSGAKKAQGKPAETPKIKPVVVPTTTCNSNSYLKRVKSKIYKSKTDSNNTNNVKANGVVPSGDEFKKPKPRRSLDVTGRIPEDEVAVLTPPGLAKSTPHFDFRLMRQTSNLERIRPRTFGVGKKCNEEEKPPMLAKAKSSSAINLNLLRARRNKIVDQMLDKCGSCQNVKDEFDFIAFGGVGYRLGQSVVDVQKTPSWMHYEYDKGEIKPGQPVSRSGSDRRPDAVREENLKHSESLASADNSHDVNQDKDEATTPESTTSLPATSNKRRATSNINRSESVKEQSEKRKQRRHISGRNISDPSHNNKSGDVELEQQPGLSNTESGSSSNSSISCNGRLSESPSNSVDAVAQGYLRGKSDSDSDMDEVDPINWQDLVSEEQLKNLNPHEKKRQDVINELFHTESSHVRSLKVLYKIFYKKLLKSQILKTEELGLIFPNIKELLDIHTDFNKEMRRRRKEDPIVKEIGDMLVNMFDGEILQRASATFCERQQLALELIKDRRRKESKFDALLAECEKMRHCRRLPLQGIIPTEMQRLSKYPLLLERLINSVEGNQSDAQSQQDELGKLRKAHNMSKEILNYVNEATKLALNRARLEDIQRHLDTSSFERSDHPIVQEFRTIDLTKYRLVLEGGMQLRRPNKAIVAVHILLLEEAVVILHREGDRFLLKFFQSGNSAQPQPLSPIIKMNNLLVRINAVCRNALFLVNTSQNNSQMYDLLAEDDAKREMWFKHFSDAADTYNKREGKTKLPGPATDSDDSESVQDLPLTSSVSERAEAVGGDGDESSLSVSDSAATRVEDNGVSEESGAEPEHRDRDNAANSPEMVAGGGVQTTRVSAEEWPLIQPSQVHVAIPPVHTAETKLTPIEQLRRKDAEVKQALADKEGLVADLLSIPREHFQHIADMASMDTSTSRDLSERVLAAIYQVDQLHLAVNQSFNISESEAMTSKGGKHPACASQSLPTAEENAVLPSVPTQIVANAANTLSSQLTTLLSELKLVEEERDRLRKELHNVRERLHEQVNLHEAVKEEPPKDLTSTV